MTALNRRSFLITTGTLIGAAAAPGLFLGIKEEATAAGAPADAVVMNAFIRITPENDVIFYSPNAEMGQSVLTSHALILAEELDVDWAKVQVRSAPGGAAYKNPAFGAQATGGSTSTRAWYLPLRKLGAAARETLKAAAAAEWNVPVAEIESESGMLRHGASGKSASYGSLAAKAATLQPPAEPALKAEKDFKFIGKPTKRLDAPEKTDGSLVYGLDLKLPDMLTAAVHMSPVFGTKIASFDATKAERMPGVKAVLAIHNGVAAVADSYWQAQKALEAVTFTYSKAENPLSSTDIDQLLATALKAEGRPAASRGDAQAKLRAAAGTKTRVLERVYDYPFLAHTTMQPITGAARLTKTGIEVWTSSQTPSRSAGEVAKITGIAPDQIVVHQMLLGGGFGRGSFPSADTQAAELAQKLKRPIKVIWSRENDVRHDHYRPVGKIKLTAALLDNGHPDAVYGKVAAPSLSAAVGIPEKNGIDQFSVEGLIDFPYETANFQVDYAPITTPVPLGFWRSVGHSFTGFVVEAFIDELAALAKIDPLQYRLDLLGAEPRQRAVTALAAEKAGWGKPMAKNWGRGLAQHASYGSFAAQVAEIEMVDGKVRVDRVVVAVDCGRRVNPLGIEAQIESAIVYGLTALLEGEITLEDGAVVQANYDDYPALLLADMPKVEVYFIESEAAPGGVGEIGTPPIAPAVINAIAAVTGKRITRLPLASA